MPLLPGEVLNKRYRILNLLGSGAYGAVYRAWDLKAEADVAVKEYLDPGHPLSSLEKKYAIKYLDYDWSLNEQEGGERKGK